jgi:hypothetical protein
VLYLLVQWHRIAQVLIRIGSPTTVETYELGILHEILDPFRALFAHQHTKMTFVISLTSRIAHDVLLHSVALLFLKPTVQHPLHPA